MFKPVTELYIGHHNSFDCMVFADINKGNIYAENRCGFASMYKVQINNQLLYLIGFGKGHPKNFNIISKVYATGNEEKGYTIINKYPK